MALGKPQGIVRYELDLHPDCKDGSPNAWRAIGYYGEGGQIAIAAGATASAALGDCWVGERDTGLTYDDDEPTED